MDGIPAALIPLAERRWHVRLASEQLPQQLVVLFQIHRHRAAGDTAEPLQVPWITDFDVVRTLWTVHGPRHTLSESLDIEPHRVSAAVQEAIRLRATANLIESAVETVMGSPANEIQAWYAPWAVRLAGSEARMARDRWLAPRAEVPLDSAAIDAIDRQQGNIAKRLNTSPTLQDLRAQTGRYAQPSDLLVFAQQADMDSRYYTFIGRVPAITLARHRSGPGYVWPQLLGACLVAAVGGLIGYSLRQDRVTARLRQWPCLPGVLIGLVWWLFASPSLLGWLIVAASLWTALRCPLPAQVVTEPASDPPAKNGV
jgi:hypothetical protein